MGLLFPLEKGFVVNRQVIWGCSSLKVWVRWESLLPNISHTWLITGNLLWTGSFSLAYGVFSLLWCWLLNSGSSEKNEDSQRHTVVKKPAIEATRDTFAAYPWLRKLQKERDIDSWQVWFRQCHSVMRAFGWDIYWFSLQSATVLHFRDIQQWASILHSPNISFSVFT